jgi:cephalosporin hydroxylase
VLEGCEFSVDWFSPHWPNWLVVTAGRTISKVLEIGSFEGRSACTVIEHFGTTGPLDIFCVDDWDREFEHGAFDMKEAERKFDSNAHRVLERSRHPVRLFKHKGKSVDVMARLLMNGHGESFDLIYVDGSHEAPDVLSDLILAYRLCSKGGLIICDDYLWTGAPRGQGDVIKMPRLAIDAFINIFSHQVEQWGNLPIYQVYLVKIC